MGGLVASGYMALGEEQRSKIETSIMLGSPLLGAPIVPYIWGSEDINVTGFLDKNASKWIVLLFDQIALYYNPIDNVIGNFSSMYEMFPTKMYFDSSFANKNYLITSIVGGNSTTITSYVDTQNRLESYLPYYNKNLANSAENFHDSLYLNNDHISSLSNTYYIAGYGIDTVDTVEFNMWDWYNNSSTKKGDGTVPVWSSTLGGKYADKTYYVKNVDHVELASDKETLELIKQLISGRTSISEFKTISKNMEG